MVAGQADEGLPIRQMSGRRSGGWVVAGQADEWLPVGQMMSGRRSGR